MPLRISSLSTYQRVLSGLHFNFNKLIRAQEQVASGRRILRPSDDPTGTSRVLSLERRMADADRFLSASSTGRAVIDAGAGALQNGSTIIADIRELVIKGMNGTLSQSDREAIADEVDLLRDQIIEIANSRSADRYLFGGTETRQQPWDTIVLGGIERAIYSGNDNVQEVQVGVDVDVAFNATGKDIFAKNAFSGVQYAGLTGIAKGTTADEGQGYEYLTLRHDSTDPGALASVGIALAGGGASDTLLGAQDVIIDPVANTVQLGGGEAIQIPGPNDPALANLAVKNELGGEVHLDFSAWNGAAYTGGVSGAGSISIDGSAFVPIDFTETDLELIHPDTGNVLHVDTTGVLRSGEELAQFGGAVGLVDVLIGIAADLRSGEALTQPAMIDRLDLRLSELDRNHDNLLVALGSLGSRSARLSNSEQRIQSSRVQLASSLSELRDADFTEVVIDMTHAEQTLQLAQATGVRLMQNSLLNFLR